jgi:hypothetical protein
MTDINDKVAPSRNDEVTMPRRTRGLRRSNTASPVWPKLFVSVVALAALVFLVVNDVDAGIGLVALVVVAILPWVATLVEAVDLPGGGSLRFRRVEQRVEIQERRVESQEKKLNEQQEIITQLVAYSMSWYLFELLSRIHHGQREGGEYLYRDNEAVRRDLRFLRDHGYLAHFYLSSLSDGQDLVKTLQLTPVGAFLVQLREQKEQEANEGTAAAGAG